MEAYLYKKETGNVGRKRLLFSGRGKCPLEKMTKLDGLNESACSRAELLPRVAQNEIFF